jgi:hypothetical protein
LAKIGCDSVALIYWSGMPRLAVCHDAEFEQRLRMQAALLLHDCPQTNERRL